ncbi:MAG: hypothetical protein MPN21_14510 [Thermoanaerobaculia bacterium]|nr:hypothetical protein [Thermoanaerobaculia bacterium]
MDLSIPIRLKPGVKLDCLSTQILLAILVASQAYQALGARSLTVTSVCDGEHSEASLHWIGHACDLRTKNLEASDEEKAQLARTIAERLGNDFDVLFEGAGTPQEHIHIEYQPKRRSN